ncbi:FxsA family protein [Craterilacuibacter sp.]|uniref:FxsA family protein n=1 Tax=Craterilacuibacter sp. TaxID=2870909 RepID=UPI003F389AF2
MRAILLLILAYPFLEVTSLIYMAGKLGGGFVLFWVLASALIGIVMLRNQRMATLLTLGALFNQKGNVSVYSLLWPVRYLLAGVLFLIPGIISDILAVILLLPLSGPGPKVRMPEAGAPRDGAIEGEYTRVDETVERDRHLHK